MASSYTTSYGIEKIGSGEQAGTWGTTTNHNLDLLDRIAAYTSVALSGTTHTLTVREASPGSGTENLQDGMYRVIKFTGALGANNTVTIAPNTTKAYFIIENATTDSGSSGPYSVILSQGSGANITVQNGKNVIVYCDGAGSGAAVVDALADLQIGTLEVTGAAAIDGGLAVTGNVTATGTVEPAGDTAASDNAAIGYTSAEGLILTGQGSTNDVTIKNDADADVLEIPTGTTNVTVVGDVTSAGTLNVTGDTAAGDDAAIGYTSAEGLILTGQGSTNDVTIKNDADADVLEIPTGTTNVTVVGDITTSATLNATGDTAAGDDAAIGYTSTEGLILTGQGSTGDVTVKNDADAAVIQIPTGTTGVDFKGNMFTTTAGTSNFVAGVNAGNTIESGGNYNVCVGDEAGTAITTGDNNVFIGYGAGDAMSTGSGNTHVGKDAGTDQTTASDNTLIGTSAGANITDGPYNTLVGNLVGDDVTSGTYMTMIGYNLAASAADGENQIVLGQGIGGEADNCFTFGKSGNKMFNNFSSNNSWSQSSDERLKTSVDDNTLGLGFINDLETKTYKWKPSNEIDESLTDHHFEDNKKDTDVLMYGMMAQNVKAAMDTHNHSSFTGWSESKDGSQNLSREMFVIPLIKAVQELSNQVQELTAQVEELKK